MTHVDAAANAVLALHPPKLRSSRFNLLRMAAFVLAGISVDLPAGADVPEALELLLRADAGEPAAVAQLTLRGRTAAANSLPVPSDGASDLKLEVRQQDSEDSLYKSFQTLGELGVGASGTAGSLNQVALTPGGVQVHAPPAEDAKGKKGGAAAPSEVLQAELYCSWRVQRELPSMREHRCPPLALKYTATSSREQHCDREHAWREEMAHLDVNPGTPAPTPKHFLGDASSRRLRANYIEDRAQMQTGLSAQAVAMHTQRLQERCLTCLTAEEASDALQAVKHYVVHGSNLSQVSARLPAPHSTSRTAYCAACCRR